MSNILKIAASGVEAAAPTEYQIERSLRFNSADSAYLNRTPASAGNRKTWTWSGWVKRSAIGSSSRQVLFDGYASSAGHVLELYQDTLTFYAWGAGASATNLLTTSLYRDVSAWYHIVLAVDTTQATTSNRTKIYVNGQQITAFTTETYLTQNADTYINNNILHNIGRRGDNQFYCSLYLTEINFVDGQALTPSDFGETDATTGVWKPKAYAGTYGTNGFYLDFSDNSSTTTLGYDAAGSNNWTPNNFSVTAGAGNDSLVDTPTPYGTDTGAGGEVRGNYCIGNWNNSSSTDILTNGALDWGCDNTRVATGTFGMSSGKWYCEGTVSAITSTLEIGIVGAQRSFTNIYTAPGSFADGYTYLSGGNKYNNNSSTAYGASYTTNDVIGIAFDADAGTITFYKNGVSQGTAFSSITAGTYVICARGTGIGPADFLMNFGQRPFAYTAPSGFKALCTTNLPDPTVVQGDDYFNTVLYTGNGTSSATTQAITGVGFQPDWVWIKNRGVAAYHVLTDAVRGNTAILSSNDTLAESSFDATWRSQYGQINTFDSDGFTVAAGLVAGGNFNYLNNTYVAWNWNAGGSNATNTDGTITSTVRANTTAGFSIATATTPASGTFTVGHGLGVAPSMFIIKGRETAGYTWNVYHKSLGAGGLLVLNSTAAFATNTGVWQNTAPSSSVIYGNSTNWGGSEDYVIYAFAEIEGFSKFGSYTGNGSTDGPFVYCGFRPAFFLIKLSSGIEQWYIIDSTRNTYNPEDKYLMPNLSDAELTYTFGDFLSNGFKLKNTSGGINGSGSTYIFMAFAENPFKYSLAR